MADIDMAQVLWLARVLDKIALQLLCVGSLGNRHLRPIEFNYLLLCMGLATTTHLANHINDNSLTKLTLFCGNSQSKWDALDFDFEDKDEDCCRFYDSLMQDQYFWQEDDLDRLLST